MDDARSSGCGDVDGVKAGRTRARGRGRPAQRTGESARGRPAPQAVAERRATPCAAAPSLLRAIIDDDKVLNASVAEAEAERAQAGTREGALLRGMAARKGQRGRGRRRGRGAACACHGQRTSMRGTAERRTGVRARRRASSFGARPQCQRAPRRRAREGRAGGAGRSGLCVRLQEDSGLHSACARRCSTCPLRVLVRPLAPKGSVLASPQGVRASLACMVLVQPV